MQPGRRRHPLWSSAAAAGAPPAPAPAAAPQWRAGGSVTPATQQQQQQVPATIDLRHAGVPSGPPLLQAQLLQAAAVTQQQLAPGSVGAASACAPPAVVVTPMQAPAAAQPAAAPAPAQSAAAPPRAPALADALRKQFLCRVRLALLDSCHAAVLMHRELVRARKVSATHVPKFPLEKLEEAFVARWVARSALWWLAAGRVCRVWLCLSACRWRAHAVMQSAVQHASVWRACHVLCCRANTHAADLVRAPTPPSRAATRCSSCSSSTFATTCSCRALKVRVPAHHIA
jgi:hypothetical protein